MSESASIFENTFKKLADEAVDIVSELRDPSAGWLFTIILRHIHRVKNSLVVTQDELAELAGMSVKTVQRKTPLLEQAGVITVIRKKETATKNAPNEYRLAGVAYSIACGTISRLDKTNSRDDASNSRSLTDHTDIHHNHDDDETLQHSFSDSDSGEFDVAGEGRDQSIEAQDTEVFAEQVEFLESVGVRGPAIHQHKRKSLRELRDLWTASASAKSNRQGFFVSLLANGVYQTQTSSGGWGSGEDEFAGLSWGDFAEA